MTDIQSDTVRISGDDDRPFEGYLAVPEEGPAPGVIVIQEIFGITNFICRVCDWLAENGFLALAPDLYWREEPGLVFDSDDTRQMAKGREIANKIGFAQMTEDAAFAAEALRGQAVSNGKVGHLGYCLGGAIAYRASTKPECDAAVSYYGTRMHTMLDLASDVRAPLLLHVATADSLCPPEAQAEIHAALGGKTGVTIYDYDGAQHAFAREEAGGYNAAFARLANQRTLEFLKAHLEQG